MEIIDYFKYAETAVIVIRAIGYGLVLAALIAFFVCITQKRVVGSILKESALSRDGAKTAEELGLRGPFSKFALREKSTLRKTVKAAPGMTEGDPVRYYIPEDEAPAAESRYVKRISPVAWIVGCALLVAATEGAVIAVPWILRLF